MIEVRSKHAEEALENQSKPVARIRLQDLADSTIDWSQFDLDKPQEMVKSPAKAPRQYQREAIDDVLTGLAEQDRGKLIMACGTGKTFTSLQIVQEQVPVGGTVLFLVPSIALLQQTLNEWTAQAQVPLRVFAVCSDSTVGRKQNEDISEHDLGFPATTDPVRLADRFAIKAGNDRLTVVFSTYQSIDVVYQAQQRGLPAFDLVVCDEAHRTTGIAQPNGDASAFVRVHDESYLAAAKRLYMTATPRIYVEESKTKAAQDEVQVYSMDDEAVYGPEFHHLGFGQAVEIGALTDYKVLVLAVDEAMVSHSFQDFLSQEGSDIPLPDIARIVGIWNGLAKRGADGERLAINDHSPMRRAVAFASNIKESKQAADRIQRVGQELVVNRSEAQPGLSLEAAHVDGTFNVLERNQRLDWLQEPLTGERCRILTNAKCLTEGVDVPSLDAVLFLNPRNSQVDVVQAVGRVMRRAEDKEYGYIVLPIAVSADADPATALNDNKKYKVVWDVLQALRAHDDRFEAMINKIDLDPGSNKHLDVIAVGPGEATEAIDSDSAGSHRGATDALFSMTNAAQWQNAIYARMVKKVGDRRYWEDWAKDVKDIADRQTTRIKTILDSGDSRVREEFEVFVNGLRGNLNDGISADDAVDMLVQHLITKPVFDALFEDYDFTAHNPVSQVMDSMLQVLDAYQLESETDSLEGFYRSVRIRAEGITSAAGKQQIITELYERFFKLAFPRVAESLGIVYTPLEVVDFIIRAVDDVLQQDFGASVSDEGVHILDPFTGTGTFIVRLLQSGRIRPEDLLRKYTQELHANEILLMAYYIAALNIEATFHGLQLEHQTAPAKHAGSVPEAADESNAGPVGAADGVGYVPFDGIVLTDTFQMTEDGDTLDEHVFTNNNDRAQAQNQLDIRVILGNPPYSVGQSSGNDNNANLKYPTLDKSIRTTYANRSNAQNKKALYDSYIRAIRWASNRILNSEHGGVVCYVSNGGYIDGNTADGLRKTLLEEFHDVYVYNLRGNQRTAGEQSRKEGGKIFDSGSRATVAILLLVKKPGPVGQGRLYYRDIGDYLPRVEKLQLVNDANLDSLEWKELTPNDEGDWINQRDPSYQSYPALVGQGATDSIFGFNASGITTSRDAWVYSFSSQDLAQNIGLLRRTYHESLEGEPNMDPQKISWSRALRRMREAGKRLADADEVQVASYRPFEKKYLARDLDLIEAYGKMRLAFPSGAAENLGFYIVGAGNPKPFSLLATTSVPDISFWGSGVGQYFSRFSYAEVDAASILKSFPTQGDLFTDDSAVSPAADELTTNVRGKADNITDWALDQYRTAYGPQVTKDDVFHYVYGLLHSSEYRQRYAADLKKSLPRIPQVAGRDRFEAFMDAGRQLIELHVGYEDVEPYPLAETVFPGAPADEYERFAVTKMRYGGKSGEWDKTRIRYNAYVDLEGIPEEAQRYMLGSRSGVDWILERYQVKADKASGIVNDPNGWAREHRQPRYIIELIGRIVSVSIETMRIVDGLPDMGVDG